MHKHSRHTLLPASVFSPLNSQEVIGNQQQRIFLSFSISRTRLAVVRWNINIPWCSNCTMSSLRKWWGCYSLTFWNIMTWHLILDSLVSFWFWNVFLPLTYLLLSSKCEIVLRKASPFFKEYCLFQTPWFVGCLSCFLLVDSLFKNLKKMLSSLFSHDLFSLFKRVYQRDFFTGCRIKSYSWICVSY